MYVFYIIIQQLFVQRKYISGHCVLYRRAEMTVRYDPQIVTETELRRVLADCGYPACTKGAPGSNLLRNALKSALGRGPER